MPRALLAFLALFLLGAVAPSAEAAPQTIVVYGDSLAEGVWSGLYELTKGKPDITLLRHSHIGTGLTRPDFASWQAEVTKQIDTEKPTVGIIMFGLNDTTGLRDENRKGYQYKSAGWREAYERRVDWLIQQLKTNGATVVWVGLPVIRKAEINEDAKYLTSLYAEVAAKSGAQFLDIYKDFADAEGNFMARIDDSKNRSQALRGEDGVHFSGYGYRLLGAKILALLDQTRQP